MHLPRLVHTVILAAEALLAATPGGGARVHAIPEGPRWLNAKFPGPVRLNHLRARVACRARARAFASPVGRRRRMHQQRAGAVDDPGSIPSVRPFSEMLWLRLGCHFR